MHRWKSEKEARDEIRSLVGQYFLEYKKAEVRKDSFKPGDRISYAARFYDENEMMSLTDAVLDFWLTSGRFVSKMEKDLCKWLNVKHAHLVNSGSSANLLALTVLTSYELGERRIKKGDEVITVAAGFPTTIAPIIQNGAVPVFVDITIPQYNIDVAMLESAYSEKTKAVMIAHTLGNPFDIKGVKEFCDKHSLWLIEDNCDSLGAKYSFAGQTRYTGTWGDIGTSSFYPPHHITMGEGGCVYTNNSLLSKLIVSYRDWGRDCVCPSGIDNYCNHRYDGQYGELPHGYDHKYVYSHLGFNLKVTDMQAAIGIEQLKKLDGFIKARRSNWERLYDILASANVYDKLILPEASDCSEPSWFGFLISVRTESGLKRDAITHYLEKHNIQTRLLFSGNIIMHPCFDELRGTDTYRVVGTLENTNYVMENSFWVGVYPGMTDEMIDYMGQTIIEAVNIE